MTLGMAKIYFFLRSSFLIIAITLVKSSYGQGFIDLARLDYNYGLDDNRYINYRSLGLNLQVPVLLKNKDALLTGIAIEGTQIRNEALSLKSRNLTFNAGYNKVWRNNKSLIFLTIHRMNGDQFEWRTDNYQLGIVGLYTYKKDENSTLQIGFYTNSEFMGQVVTPLFGVDWKVAPKIRFYGVLPASGTLAIQQNAKWYYGLNFLGIFQTYQQPEMGDFYIQRSINQLSVYSDFYLTKQVVFNIKLGYRAGSGYRLFSSDDKVDWALNVLKFGDNRDELGRIATNGFILTMGLAFRYDLSL